MSVYLSLIDIKIIINESSLLLINTHFFEVFYPTIFLWFL